MGNLKSNVQIIVGCLVSSRSCMWGCNNYSRWAIWNLFQSFNGFGTTKFCNVLPYICFFFIWWAPYIWAHDKNCPHIFKDLSGSLVQVLFGSAGWKSCLSICNVLVAKWASLGVPCFTSSSILLLFSFYNGNLNN